MLSCSTRNRMFTSRNVKKCALVCTTRIQYSLPRGGSSRVPAPRTSADLSGKKRRPVTADFQIWEVHFGPWKNSRLTLSLQNSELVNSDNNENLSNY